MHCFLFLFFRPGYTVAPYTLPLISSGYRGGDNTVLKNHMYNIKIDFPTKDSPFHSETPFIPTPKHA